MADLARRAAAMRESNAAAQEQSERAAREWNELSRSRVAEFIGRLTTANKPTVSVYAETWRHGDPAKGDARSYYQLGNHYPDVQTGYLRVGDGWVVQKYDHNGWDIAEGMLVFRDGRYTRELDVVTHVPDAGLANVPEELPFYRTGPRVFEGEQFILPQSAEFAHDAYADMLAGALVRYDVA